MVSRVSLRAPAFSRRPSGEEIPNEGTVVATVWASVTTISGSKSWREQQVQPELTHEVEIRYRDGLQAGWLVDYYGSLLHVNAALPTDDGMNLVLLCSERADGVRN